MLILTSDRVRSCCSICLNRCLCHDQTPFKLIVRYHSYFLRHIIINIGFLDTMRQLGTIIGLILNLFVTFTKPKQAFFILTTLKCLLILMMPLMKITGMNEVVLSFLMVGIGMLKLQQFIPAYILGNFLVYFRKIVRPE